MKHTLLRMLLFSIFMAFFALYSYSQGPPQCWDFEENCIIPDDAFHAGCIADAQSASGSPDTRSDYPGVTAFSGSKYAHMYAKQCQLPGEDPNRFHAEGIILKHNFKAGKLVKITFAVRSTLYDAPYATKLILLNDLPNYGGVDIDNLGCLNQLDIPPGIPAASETITTLSYNQIPEDHWVIKTIHWVPQANYNQIWFRPFQFPLPTPLNISKNIYLDKVCIEDLCAYFPYAVSTCNYIGSGQDVVNINGAPVRTEDWTLFTVPDCVTYESPIEIPWLPNQTSFTLPDNSGCYLLVGNSIPRPGCPQQQFPFLINTSNSLGTNPPCTPCTDWLMTMTLKLCQQATFEITPEEDFSPPTSFTFLLDNVLVQSGDNNIYSAPIGGANGISPGWHEVCVTVAQGDCPPKEKCYEFYVDCFGPPPGGDRQGAENGQDKTAGNSLLISNPSSGSIWMSVPFEEGTARLYSMQGSLVKSFALNETDRLDVSELSAGEYILAIQGPDFSVSKMVFIQNQH